MTNRFACSLLSGLIIPFLSFTMNAQEVPIDRSVKTVEPPTSKGGFQGNVNSGYVAGSNPKFLGTKLSSSDAFNLNFDAGTRMMLNEKWFLRFGLGLDNTFLNQVSGAPIPESINTLRLTTGLGYRLNDQWTLSASVSPSLYRFEDVGGNTFGVSGMALVMYHANPSLTWTFGIIVSPNSDIPLLPVVGVRWLINDDFTLKVEVPQTRLTYRLDSKWTFYGGAEMNSSTFRAAEDLGTKTGFPQYNNALGSYRDVRVGVGAGYEITRSLFAEIDGGYSVYRRIEYTRIDESVDFEPAPYVRLGLSIRF